VSVDRAAVGAQCKARRGVVTALILVGFVLLGLSYGRAAGSVTSNFLPRFRYTPVRP